MALKQVTAAEASNLLRENKLKNELLGGIEMKFVVPIRFEYFSIEKRVDLRIVPIQ